MASFFSAVRDLGRLREIVSVLTKHGFGDLLGRMGLSSFAPASTQITKHGGEKEKTRIPWAIRVRLVLQDLGPSFIKLGQIVSTRADLLPKELIVELKKLQDDVPPVSFEAIKKEIEAELAATLDEVYVRFEEAPLATASIGQVHRATLRAQFDDPELQENGSIAPPQEREVVVKAQRPGVKETVERDLELLHLLAAVLDRSIEEARIYDPVGLVQQFDRSITAELDFTTEAGNAERFRRNFKDHQGICFPKVYKKASAKKVLTIDYFEGKKVYAALEGGASGPALAKKAVGIVIKMIFEDGFFHADPHPGNIIILGPPDAPVIGMIDLGMVGRLSPEMRDKTIRLMVAAVRNDARALADALYAIGKPTKKIDMAEFRATVAILSEKYLGRPLKEIELSAMISDLVNGATEFGLEIPTDFLMVGKSLMTIEGIGKELDPDLDVFAEAKPYFIELLQRRYSPEAIGKDLLRGAEKFLGVAHDLPVHLQEVLDDVRMGRMQIQIVDTQAAPTLDRLGRRILTGMVVGSLNVAGAITLMSRWKYNVWGAALLFVSAWLAWAIHVGSDAFKAWWAKGKRR